MPNEPPPSQTSDLALLRAVGVAMYGPQWRRPMARAVGVSGSLLAAVDAGHLPLSDDVRRVLGVWAAREAAAEVVRARERIALLDAMRDAYVGTL